MTRSAVLRTLAIVAVALVGVAIYRFVVLPGAPPEAPPVAQAPDAPTAPATEPAAETPSAAETPPAADVPPTPRPEATGTAPPVPEPTASQAPGGPPEPPATAEPPIEPAAPPGLAPEGTPSSEPTAPAAQPDARARALRAVADGDPETAVPLLQEALETATGEDAVRLRVALGRVLYESDRHREAAAALEALDPAGLPDALAVEALGLLARAREAAGDWQGAIAAYDRLLPYPAVPQDIVRFQAARAYTAMGTPSNAAAQLEAIDLAAVSPSRRAEILEELAEARLDMDDPAGAAEAYGRILGFAENYAYVAQVLARQGDALRAAGRHDEAMACYRRVLDAYGDTATAAAALQALDELGAGGGVTGLQRGVALYAAWRYTEAAGALSGYLAGEPAEGRDRAQYYLGMANQSLGDHAAAIGAFDGVVTGDAASPYLDDAWFAKAQSLAATGQDAAAFYALFADTFPAHGSAPRALWLAAERLERARDWGGAAHYYNLMHTRYPSDSGAAEARFREGLAAYAGGDIARAYSVWQGALPGTAGEGRARLLTWLGLAGHRAGEDASARGHWQEAAAASPEGYYGLRAADLAGGVSLSASPAGGAVADGALTAEDWGAIEGWVVGWAGAGALEADISTRADVQRALALWSLNWHAEATEVLRGVRGAIQDDAGAVLSLLRITVERGIPPFAIWAAERLPVLAAHAGGGAAPGCLRQAAFPTIYGHLVAAEAERWGWTPTSSWASCARRAALTPCPNRGRGRSASPR